MAEPEGVPAPYEIIVLLGSTNTYPPEKPLMYGPSDIVSYATVPVVFVHWNTGEFPGSPAAYVPGVFIAATKLVTHAWYV